MTEDEKKREERLGGQSAEPAPGNAEPTCGEGGCNPSESVRNPGCDLDDPRFHTLIEASLDPFFITDSDGVILRSNKAASRVTGRSSRHLAGMELCECFTEPAEVREAWKELLKEGAVGDISLKIRRRDGEIYNIRFNASLFNDESGRIAGAFAAARDITKRKRREKELRKYREHLEDLIAERTSELAKANELLRLQVIERKRIETALRESEGRFRRLAEHAPDIIYRYEIKPQRRYSYVSPGVEVVTGRTAEEYYADPNLAFRLVHPEDRPLLEALLRAGGQAESLPAFCLPSLRWLRGDATVVWTEEHTVPIFDDAGNLVAVEGIARNITQRKQAELALQTAHQQLSGIIEFLPDATFVIDRERKVIAWNMAIEEMTGVSKQEILGKGDYAHSVPFYGESRPVLIDLIFSEEAKFELRYDCVQKKGHTLYAEAFAPKAYQGKGAYLWVTASPLCDAAGNLIGAIESIRDITDAKRDQEALRTTTQQLQGIIEFLPDATFVIDRERKVIAWNLAIEDMTGTSKEDILGRGDYAYAYPFYGEPRPILIDLVFSEEAEYRKKYDYVITKGHTLYAEAFVPKVYGERGAYLWITASPLYDGAGNIIGAIESIRDITERKKLEDALRSNAERIKHFAYSVSHDLKSPIIGINGLTRLLHRQYRDFLDAKGKLFCDQILKASEQVVTLIEEINVYIKTKEIPLDFETIQPKEIIRIVKNEFEALLSVRQIEWKEPESIPSFKADRVSVLRVLRNLVDNALKYGGENLSEIKVGYRSTPEYHVLSVTDDGVGIKGEDTEKIFGLFQRNETSKGVEGTGLGLAIVKEIAEKHKGKVWVEPGVTRGTSFFVYISKDL